MLSGLTSPGSWLDRSMALPILLLDQLLLIAAICCCRYAAADILLIFPPILFPPHSTSSLTPIKSTPAPSHQVNQLQSMGQQVGIPINQGQQYRGSTSNCYQLHSPALRHWLTSHQLTTNISAIYHRPLLDQGVVGHQAGSCYYYLNSFN